MSKAAYIGIDGLSRKIKNMYVSVDGVAHKVKKGYVGVDGVVRQFYSLGTLVVHPTVALNANSSNGYVVTASSENSSAYDAWKAFDKTYSSRYGWASKTRSTDASPYIQIKLPSAQKITKVSIANRTFSIVNGVIAATVMGSNNGSSWTTICTISGRKGSTSGLLTEHECTDTGVAYQYVRIKPTNWDNYNNSTTSNRHVAIGEIYITCLVEDMSAYASGNPVSFNAAVGTDISPTTVMKMRQSGSGEASPENVRKITSYDVLKLNHHGADEASTLRTYTADMGNAVCCGSYDWTSGKLTMDYGFYKLDGTVKPYEANVIGEFTRAGFNVLPFKAMDYVSYNTDGAFSHGQYLMSWGSESTHAYANGWTIIITMPTALVGSTIDSFAEYLAAQNAAGTPVQIAYKLLERNVIQLAAQQITALTPYQTNVLYGDGDTINVEYTK